MVTTSRKLQTGYKQTDVGVIPENWDVKKLNDIVSQVIDNRGKTPPYSDDEDVELIETASISFVNQYPDYSKITKFVSRKIYDNWFRGHPVEGDILVSTVGEYSGSSAIMEENRGTIAQNLIALRIKEVNSTYIFYWARSENFKKQLDQVMMNQAQPSLRVPWLLNFCLSVPKRRAEQNAIVNTLSDVDALITSLEKLIAKKRAIKQGAMQELLTGKRRLPGLNGKWETKALDEIGEISGAGIDKKIKPDEIPIRLVNYLDVYHKNFIYSKDLNHWVTAPAAQFQRCLVKKGDVFFTPSSEMPFDIGISAIAGEDIDDAGYSYHVVRLRLKEDWNIKFRAYVFKTNFFLGQAEKFCEGSGKRYVISLTKFRRLLVKFPVEILEQTAIAQVLSDMDSEIDLLEKKLGKYRMAKQGMMQILLTGKVRLI